MSGVLIETYWNVNTLKKLKIMLGLMVLIETYWNVNRDHPIYRAIQKWY